MGLYWDNGKKMETTGIIGIIGCSILGLYRDNGKENGSYYIMGLGFRVKDFVGRGVFLA